MKGSYQKCPKLLKEAEKLSIRKWNDIMGNSVQLKVIFAILAGGGGRGVRGGDSCTKKWHIILYLKPFFYLIFFNLKGGVALGHLW